jgi:hypothetical protein
MPLGNLFRLTLLTCFLCLHANAGYTHYFRWCQKPDEASLSRCINEMRRIVDARKSMLAGPEAEGEPMVTAQSLVFNGVGDNGHEPFVFPGDIESTPRGPKIPAGFNFCKTAAKPYDEVVTACLLVARDHFPPSVLAIESDGSWPDDWRDGASLYSSVLGRPARNPFAGEVVLGSPPVHGSESDGFAIAPKNMLALGLGAAMVLLFVRKVWG